jgi:hypothetical protein
VRFSRPTARVHFSKVAVIGPFDGMQDLMIRVGNLRRQAMVEPEFRMFFNRDIVTAEGDNRLYCSFYRRSSSSSCDSSRSRTCNRRSTTSVMSPRSRKSMRVILCFPINSRSSEIRSSK